MKKQALINENYEELIRFQKRDTTGMELPNNSHQSSFGGAQDDELSIPLLKCLLVYCG